MAAGLLAKKAVEKGLTTKPWVKTSLAPGLEGRHRVPRRTRASSVPRAARLQRRRLRLHDVHRQHRPAPAGDLEGDRRAATSSSSSVLSRQPQLRGPRPRRGARELPRVAAARRRLRARGHAWTSTSTTEPLGTGKDGKPVFLKDIWPTQSEVADAIAKSVTPAMFKTVYADVYRRRRAVAVARRSPRATSTRGSATVDVRQEPAVLRRA